MSTSLAPPDVQVPNAKGIGGRRTLLRLLRKPSFALSAAWMIFILVATFGAGFLAPQDPLKQNLYDLFKGPSKAHLLGTDSLGRDVLSRLMHGGAPTILAGLEVVVIAVAIGVPVGLISGYYGGWSRAVGNRFADLLFAIPALALLLAIVAVTGQGVFVPMAALGILISATFIRLVSACVLEVRRELFIDAARVSGVRNLAIITRHVLPNIAAPVAILATITFGFGLLVQASLGYLGLGVQLPAPDWGKMVADASTYVAVSPWMMLPPGLCIALTVMSINFLGDALHDVRLETTRGSARRTPATDAQVAAAADSDGLGTTAVNDGAVLSVRNLTVEFGGVNSTRVVENVSFDIAPGEVLGLVGESGCGKSVTALSILGLLPDTGRIVRGEISQSGRALVGVNGIGYDSVRGKEIAYIPQEPMSALDPSFSVSSHLVELLRRHHDMNRKAAKARAIELLSLVEVPEPKLVMRRYPHQLSGGMAQRVLIAMALAGEPKLLIADEPTTALDVTVQAEILDLLRSVQERLGMAILLVTHDLGVVADICSRVMVMYAGQIVESGEADDVFASPTHPYTSALLQSNPELSEDDEGDLPSISGDVPLPGAWPGGCRFAPRCAFSVHKCTEAPIPLMHSDDRLFRCIRVGEIAMEGTRERIAESR
jgi:peptide/nickel transport system permease protein